jgi:hypothetical protein
MSTVTLLPTTLASGLPSHAIPNSRRSNVNVAWMPIVLSGFGPSNRPWIVKGSVMSFVTPCSVSGPRASHFPPAFRTRRLWNRISGNFCASKKARDLDDGRRARLREIARLAGADLDVVAHELARDLRDAQDRDRELDVRVIGVDRVLGGGKGRRKEKPGRGEEASAKRGGHGLRRGSYPSGGDDRIAPLFPEET